MKTQTNQAQIERRSNGKVRIAQRLRELLITEDTKCRLQSLAITLGCDPMRIAERAVESYLDFVQKFQQLAQAQPRLKRCDALLLLPQKLMDALDNVCAIYHLEANQVAESAVAVYADFAEWEENRHFFHELGTADPGGIDPENIAYLLSKASSSASAAFERILSEVTTHPFNESIGLFYELLELTKHHPGFEQRRAGLEMIVEGAQRIQSR
jgi:hypothetical protein